MGRRRVIFFHLQVLEIEYAKVIIGYIFQVAHVRWAGVLWSDAMLRCEILLLGVPIDGRVRTELY